MKVRTKLNVGQTVFSIDYGNIIPKVVEKIEIDITIREIKDIVINYRLKKEKGQYASDLISVKESELKKEDIFTRKDDAKMELYKRIAEM